LERTIVRRNIVLAEHKLRTRHAVMIKDDEVLGYSSYGLNYSRFHLDVWLLRISQHLRQNSMAETWMRIVVIGAQVITPTA
jgi:hypothetical protein